MKERGILFNGEMVRAIPAGKKTQTRRPARLTGSAHVKEPGGHRRWHPGDPNAYLASPYGVPGDRLWVRETWGKHPLAEGEPPDHIIMKADGSNWLCYGDHPERGSRVNDDCKPPRWRPSIHMPRWASRITLEVTGVRVERVQSITTEDVIAEGLTTNLRGYDAECDLRDQFKALWDAQYGSDETKRWNANPWVWVVEFKPVDRSTS